MAHFAELNNESKVIRVVVVNNQELLDGNGDEQEQLGVDFCVNLFGGRWVQTSYNGSFRKNFAGSGYTYDEDRDAFIEPRPYPSWTLNEDTCIWEPPIAAPLDTDKVYVWEEETTSWRLVE
jgi:hypothetical protein